LKKKGGRRKTGGRKQEFKKFPANVKFYFNEELPEYFSYKFFLPPPSALRLTPFFSK
jgi:hypothetical protein